HRIGAGDARLRVAVRAEAQRHRHHGCGEPGQQRVVDRQPAARRCRTGRGTHEKPMPRGTRWTPDGEGTSRSSWGTSRTDENSRATAGAALPDSVGMASSAGSGSRSVGTDQPVRLNSPPLSIQVSEMIGSNTILVNTARVQDT